MMHRPQIQQLGTVVFALFFSTMCAAQGNLFLRTFSTDSSGLRRAQGLYFAPSGQIANFAKEEVVITEDGVPARIVSVECLPPAPSVDVSSVLTIDVSGSMRFGGPNIELATKAAAAWVDALDKSSEAAITAFDHSTLLQADLTSNKQTLYSAIARLRPRGGTNYERALLDSAMGSLAIARTGKHRKVIVFLTDGFGTLQANSVISRALADSVTIYCVTLGLNMPGVLQHIAESTGGLWFDNVTTVEQAIMAYQRIFADATGAGGCTVVWEPPIACKPSSTLQARVHAAQYSTTLDIPENRTGGINVSETSVHFDSSGTTEKIIAIVPKSAPVTISQLTISRPDIFTVRSPALPITLARTDTMKVRITCTKADSTFTVAHLDIASSPCPAPTIYVSVGNPQWVPNTQTLQVVYPNGGERLPVKSVGTLRWRGLPPEIPVRVEVSLDSGATWILVDEAAKMLEREWNTGSEASDRCLLRVTHLKSVQDRQTPEFTLAGFAFSDVEFSPNGEYLVTAETPGLSGAETVPPPARVWDAESGREIRTLGQGQQVAFSNDGSLLLTWARDSVSLYAMPQGTKLWSQSVRTLPTRCVISKNNAVVVIGGGDNDNTLVLNAATGRVLTHLPRRNSLIRWVDVDEHGKQVAVCERDSVVSVFALPDTLSPTILRMPRVPEYYKVAFCDGGRRLVTTDGTGQAVLWDVRAVSTPTTLAVRQFRNDNGYIAISPDERRVAIETGRDETKIVDLATGSHVVSIRRMSEPGGAVDARMLGNGQTLLLRTLSYATAFDAFTGVQVLRVQCAFADPSAPNDGSRMAVINASGVVQVYNLKSPLLQQDVSDSLWTIFRAVARINPVRLQQLAVGQSTDSIVVNAIENTGIDPVTVSGLRIEGAQAADFDANVPKTFTLAPGQVLPITYAFHPNGVGERAALIVAQTSCGVINARISGRCVGGVIRAGAESKDLGTVPVATPTRFTISDLVKNEGLQPVFVRSVRIAEGSDPTIALHTTGGFRLEAGGTKAIDVEVNAASTGRYATQLEFLVDGIAEPVTATLFVRADTLQFEHGADPTTFRSIMLPSAVIPEAGTITTGVYDVVGLSASYSVTDHVAVQIGGMLPVSSAWLGATGLDATMSAAWSAGAKVGYRVAEQWIAGGGYQFGQSYYNQEPTVGLDSKISFHALWATAGYGTEDSRLNMYLGYAFKHHTTLVDGQFNADATIAGLAYDYRFDTNWKLCAETIFMRTMAYIPITMVARYFRETDAFEVGFTFVGIRTDKQSTGWPVFPLVTWVKRW